MELTNRLNLPGALYDAVVNDGYDSGDSDYTATGLLKPPRAVALQKKFGAEISEDASDRIWSLMGQAIHAILERSGEGGIRIVERRFSQEIDGKKVSGQVDIIEDRILYDYKYMSVWEIIYGLKPEKEQQLNILAYLSAMNGVPVSKIKVVGILRDWQKSKAKYDREYPQEQVAVIEVPLWEPDWVLKFIRERMDKHDAANAMLPECTDEERWYTGDKYAVIKVGNKKASRVLDTEEEAQEWRFNNLKGDMEIVHRPGVNKRCDDYCAVAPFCDQYQGLIE